MGDRIDAIEGLKRVYLCRMAHDLDSSRDPLRSGIAAELADKPMDALNIFEKEAARGGDRRAQVFLNRMRAGTCTDLRRRVMIRSGSKAGWNDFLGWLPVDMETLAVMTGPFPYPDSDQPTAEFRQSLCGLVTGRPMAHALEGKVISFAMTAARHFIAPYGIGGARFESVTIAVLSKDAVSRYIEKASHNAGLSESINGFPVMVFKEEPDDDSREPRYRFVSSPLKNVLMSTTSRTLMYQVLQRACRSNKDRAFPPSIAEWKEVESDQIFWAIRHYNKSQGPFDRSMLLPLFQSGEDADSYWDTSASGIAFYLTAPGKAVFKYLSNDPIAKRMRKEMWQGTCAPDMIPKDNGSALRIDLDTTGEKGYEVLVRLLDALGFMANF